MRDYRGGRGGRLAAAPTASPWFLTKATAMRHLLLGVIGGLVLWVAVDLVGFTVLSDLADRMQASLVPRVACFVETDTPMFRCLVRPSPATQWRMELEETKAAVMDLVQALLTGPSAPAWRVAEYAAALYAVVVLWLVTRIPRGV
jgi:hypothetical protein